MSALYATGAFAEQLGISKASLQHYITILEEHGYEVRRNNRMHRQFSDDDLIILQAFLTLYKNRGLKLKEAAQTVTSPKFEPAEILQHAIIPSSNQVSQFEDLSNSMELIATHIYGIEQKNGQLLTLIEEQRTQNELLIEQNQTLKQQFGVMMQHIME
ncbi:MAG: MerR family transcriptional regulator, partial [Solibacillus sp.]